MTPATPKHVAVHGQEEALAFFGVKEARHSLDRLQERTRLPPDLIPMLEAKADQLSDQVPEGYYYLPLQGPAGEHVGYAAFKTVPGYPRSRLVLATILAPHMKPKGTNLSHVMAQPKLASVFNADDPEATPYDRVVRRQFNDLASTMREQGALAGTAHKRIVIPKDRFTETDIQRLGFTPVTVAIPEAGQDRFQSFRHPDNNFHIHSHPTSWTMHEDGHAAATMLAKKAKGLGEKAKAMAQGIPHVNEEGLPGLYYYVKGVLSGHKSTAERVFKELPTEAKLKLYGMAQSPTAILGELKQKLEAQREKLSEDLEEEGERVPDQHPLAGVATSLGVMGGLPAAALGYGAHMLKREVDKYELVNPEMLRRAKAWTSLNPATMAPDEYVRQYARGGADLSANTVIRTSDGAPLSGAQFIDKVRGGPLGQTLINMGFANQYDDAAKQHYTEFAKGPAAAFSQMAHEVDDNMVHRLKGDLLGARYEAARRAAKNGLVHPSLFRKNLHEEMLKRMEGVDPEHVQRFVNNIESQMMNEDSTKYIQHLKTVAAGQEAGPIQDELLGKVLGKNKGNTREILQARLRRAAGKMNVPAMPVDAQDRLLKNFMHQDGIGQFATLKTAPAFRDAPKKYAPLINGLGFYRQYHDKAVAGLRKARGIGAAGALAGLGLTGLGLYGALKTKPMEEEKTAEVLAKIRSSRDRRRKYDIHVMDNGKVGCTCPDFIYRRKRGANGECKHLKEYLSTHPQQKTAELVIDGVEELRQKLADVITDLKPHQQRVVDRMADPDQPGLVAVHGLGSGKTLTSIAVADRLGLPADVVVPAALQANYAKELVKHTTTPPDARILSMENTARKGPRTLERPLMIVDEAHRLRNPGKTQSTLMKSPAEKRLLLTGSLVYNHPSDMAPLVNMVAGEKTLPQNPSEFEGRYIRTRQVGPGLWGGITGAPSSTVLEVNPRHKDELQQILKKYVDYHPGSTEGFPQREDQLIRVPMTEHQRKLDDALMNDMPAWAREKILKNLPPNKTEAKQLNTFMNAVRQNANTTRGFDIETDPHQPKIERAVQELQKLLEINPRAKAVVYSNYLDSGVNPYKAQLDQHKIPYGEFTGQMNKSQRDQMVRDYNEDKLKALLLSSAGGEGLDLKGTNLIQVLEPHWNEEKIKQVIGRGIRFKSHDHLPEEQRKVLIQRFLSTRPRTGLLEKLKFKDPGGSADEYLYNRSNEKEQLNQQFRTLLA